MQIISFALIVIYLFILGWFLWYVYRRDTLKNLYSLGANVLSFLEAFLVTRLSVHFLAGSLENFYTNMLLDALKDWPKQEAIQEIFSVVFTMMVSVLCFFLFYLFFLLLNHFLKKLLFHVKQKITYKEFHAEHKNIALSMVAGICSFAITSYALLFPFGSISGIFHDAISKVHYDAPKEIQWIANQPILRGYSYLGSRGFMNTLTKPKNSKYPIRNTEELEGIFTISFSFLEMVDEKDTKENIDIIRNELKSTYLVSGFIGELCANASLKFKDGEEFAGIKVEVKDHQTDLLLKDIFSVISTWEREDFVADLDTMLDVYQLFQEQGVFQIEDSKQLLAALEEEEFSSELFLALFDNRDFQKLIPSFMNFGINKLLESFQLQTDVEYISTFNIESLTREEIQKEAHIFSLILKQMELLSHPLETWSTGDIKNLYENLLEIKDSKLLSDVLYNLLYRLVAHA